MASWASKNDHDMKWYGKIFGYIALKHIVYKEKQHTTRAIFFYKVSRCNDQQKLAGNALVPGC